MSGGTERMVCVTGASGYIASWLVKLLLQRGYTVNASVRDPNDPKKTQHLLALDGAKERLRLFKADLLEEGSFDSAIDGCEGVFHTASPVLIDVTDPQAELIDPAVKGTLDVLRSCAKASSVKRVVFTSSMSTVLPSQETITSDVVVDETWFADPASCEKSKNPSSNIQFRSGFWANILTWRLWGDVIRSIGLIDEAENPDDQFFCIWHWYKLSKILAEEAAWKFAKENGIDMVTVNPGWVIGPLLQPTVNATVEPILKYVNGDERALDAVVPVWVDVRDTANAHILAFENPSANGRYCLVGSTISCSKVMKILWEIFPNLILPDNSEDDHDKPFVSTYKVSKEKAESLGLQFTTVEVTLKDTFESFSEKNFLSV